MLDLEVVGVAECGGRGVRSFGGRGGLVHHRLVLVLISIGGGDLRDSVCFGLAVAVG